MSLRDKVDHAILQVEDKLDMEDLADVEDTEITHKIQTLYRETLLRCYNFGCEVSLYIFENNANDSKDNVLYKVCFYLSCHIHIMCS